MVRLLATHARWVLVAGLIAGVALPGWAALLTPYLQWMVAVILALAAFRIGPGVVTALRLDAARDMGAVLALQLALPLALLAVAWGTGQAGHPLTLALVLMLAAPPIMSAPALCQMMGGEGARAMRLLVMGSAALPLTVVPVLWLLPSIGGFEAALSAALALAVLVMGAVAAGLIARARMPDLRPDRLAFVDAVMALLLAVFVIALMPAVARTFATDPWALAGWMAAAFAANLGLQTVVWLWRGSVDGAVVAGNRNMSLFLAALDPQIMAPVLVFLGCYQIPMFLTPVLMDRLYRKGPRAPAS